MNCKEKQYPDGILKISEPKYKRVILTFIRTENLVSGYGVSRAFHQSDLCPEVEALFLEVARDML